MNTVRTKQGSTGWSRIDRRSGFGIVESRIHEESTTRLPDGAERCVNCLGVRREDVQVFSCAGAFELPQGTKLLFEAESYDAIICHGAVSRGESPHVEQISSDAARTIQFSAVHRAVAMTSRWDPRTVKMIDP